MRRTGRHVPIAAASLGLVVLSGCAAVAVDRPDGFDEVSATVRERAGLEVAWPGTGEEENAVSSRVGTLLEDGLEVDEAVAIALLANRDLRAIYADLGVARSDLVQAGLLHNPVFDASAGFPIGGGAVDLSLGLALDVIDFLYVPLRKRIAAAELQEVKLRVAATVLDVAWRTRTAFLRHQANEQLLEMRRQIAESTAASLDLAQRLREAGNIPEVDLLLERSLADEARLEARAAEIAVRESREEVNTLLGLWGERAGWMLASLRLPDPPDAPGEAIGLESRAIERSLDLAAMERRVLAAAEQMGLTRASALFPEVLTGVQTERNGRWQVGPSLALALPFFDWGQARTARARSELERARDLHHALAVRIRAATRSARDRVTGERDRALFYRDVQLPLLERLVHETHLRYNAMQIGVSDVLRAKERQIATGARYVEALRDYWLAHADLSLILAGKLPAFEHRPVPAIDPPRRSPIPTLG